MTPPTLLDAADPRTDHRDTTPIADRLTVLLDEIAGVAPLPEDLHHHGISEAWFSDHLAWLLDPRGSHGLGARFADAFLKRVARIRTAGHPDEDHTYNNRGQFLRWGRTAVRGTTVSGLDLRNAAIFREFYLAHASASGRSSEGMLCDVVLLDLDPSDGIIVAIENKLFTTNHRGQLERYYDTIEDRFGRARVREYVYLTLLGDPPLRTSSARSRRCDRTWVRVSWVRDVLPLIESFLADQPRLGTHELTRVLRWLGEVVDGPAGAELRSSMGELEEMLLARATSAFVEELRLLGAGAPGEWMIRRMDRTRVQIRHSSRPKKPLFLDIQPNLSLTLTTRQRKHDRLVVPLVAFPDQVVNLIRLAARETYPLHFGAGHGRYRGAARRWGTPGEEWADLRDLARVVWEREGELRLLAGLGALRPATTNRST